MEDTTGATPLALAAASPSDLIEQLNQATRRVRIFAPCLVLAVVLVVLALGAFPLLGILLAVIAVPSLSWLRQLDEARHSVVVFYDVNDEAATRFTQLVSAFSSLQGCQKVWLMVAQGQINTTYDHKVNAGASALVNRVDAARTTDGPKVLKTNIVVPTVSTSQRSFFFLPDRILVQQGKSIAEVAYNSCHVSVSATQFIETSPPPRDSIQVDTTWKYVNVNGGPDRRFKDNRQLPVMQYGEVEIVNSLGFHCTLQTSNLDAGVRFATAAQGMAP